MRFLIVPVALPAFEASGDPWAEMKRRLRTRSADVTIEALTLDDGVVVLCDEEGRFKELPVNRLLPARMPEYPEGFTIIDNTAGDHPAPGEMGVHPIRGEFALTRYAAEQDNDRDDWGDLTDADVAKYLAMLNARWTGGDGEAQT